MCTHDVIILPQCRPGGNEAEVQRLLEEAAAAAQTRGQLETQLDAARAAVSVARLEHETTKVRMPTPSAHKYK